MTKDDIKKYAPEFLKGADAQSNIESLTDSDCHLEFKDDAVKEELTLDEDTMPQSDGFIHLKSGGLAIS